MAIKQSILDLTSLVMFIEIASPIYDVRGSKTMSFASVV